jgi:uncharacterized delta-60 repeat protein
MLGVAGFVTVVAAACPTSGFAIASGPVHREVLAPTRGMKAEVPGDSRIDGKGRLLIAGVRLGSDVSESGVFVRRLRPSGFSDTSFGPAGEHRMPFTSPNIRGVAMGIQPGGKIVVAAGIHLARFRREQIEVERLTAAGRLDPTFGDNGRLVYRYSGLSAHLVRAMVITPRGRIAILSSTGRDGDFEIARLMPGGQLDRGFSGDGRVMFTHDLLIGYALRRDASGRLLVGGTNGGSGFLIARLTSAGRLDTTFGAGGYVLTRIAGGSEAHRLVLQPDGRIIAVGQATTDSMVVALARYLPDGELDPEFGHAGVVTTQFVPPPDAEHSGSTQAAVGAALMGGGRILVTGTVDYVHGSRRDMLVARYLPDGRLDGGFPGEGAIAVGFRSGPSAGLMVHVSAGMVIAVGAGVPLHSSPRVEIARITPD